MYSYHFVRNSTYSGHKRRKSSTIEVKVVDNHSPHLRFEKVHVPFNLSPTPTSTEQFPSDSVESEQHVNSDTSTFNANYNFELPTTCSNSYQSRQEQAAKSWAAACSSLFRSRIEIEAMPIDRRCIICQKNNAVAYCIDCGALGFYCISCIELLHTSINFTHNLYMEGKPANFRLMTEQFIGRKMNCDTLHFCMFPLLLCLIIVLHR